MKENKNKFLCQVAKLADKVGRNSVGKCFLWFGQPKVPNSMIKEKEKNN